MVARYDFVDSGNWLADDPGASEAARLVAACRTALTRLALAGVVQLAVVAAVVLGKAWLLTG